LQGVGWRQRRVSRGSATQVLPSAYIGSRGWVALRLDTGKVDWDEVRELLLGSYMLVAPARLAEQVKSLL
jgi:predicted DNA-binding protein (MmcQ/YjbR family)